MTVSHLPVEEIADQAVHFTVTGKPVGQGRISTINGRSFHSNGRELDAWRNTVGDAAREALGGRAPFAPYQPVRLLMVVTVHRPKRPRGVLPTTRGLDIDHALRAVGDALTGVVFTDDAQLVDVRVLKVYADDPIGLPHPGVRVSVLPVVQAGRVIV